MQGEQTKKGKKRRRRRVQERHMRDAQERNERELCVVLSTAPFPTRRSTRPGCQARAAALSTAPGAVHSTTARAGTQDRSWARYATRRLATVLALCEPLPSAALLVFQVHAVEPEAGTEPETETDSETETEAVGCCVGFPEAEKKTLRYQTVVPS